MNEQEKAIKDQQEELKFCILKGVCPYCLSKKIKYQEFLANQRFGFDCLSCSWKGQFSIRELMKFSNRCI